MYPVRFSGVVEFDETFVFDCYKGAPVPESAGHRARKHGAKASKGGIPNEHVAICTGISRDGDVVAEKVNRETICRRIKAAFQGHLAKDMIALTDGLRSYSVLETLANCTEL